jgi:hypothetical protein
MDGPNRKVQAMKRKCHMTAMEFSMGMHEFSSEMIEARVETNPEEKRDEDIQLNEEEIGYGTIMALYYLGTVGKLETFDRKKIEICMVALIAYVAMFMDDNFGNVKTRKLPLVREFMSSENGSVVESIVTRALGVRKLDSEDKRRMRGNLGERDISRIQKVMDLMCDHFKKMMGCEMEYITDEEYRLKEFMAFVEYIMPRATCDSIATSSIDATVQEAQQKWMAAYLDKQVMMEHERWMQTIQKDQKLLAQTWRNTLAGLEEIERKQIQKELTKSEEHARSSINKEASIVITRQMRCFKQKDGALTWDQGDCDKVNENLQWILNENKPSIDEEYRSNMKNFRNEIMTIQRALSTLVSDDRDLKRKVWFRDLDVNNVEAIAKALQQLLIGDMVTANMKHVNEVTSQNIRELNKMFVNKILQRQVMFSSEEMTREEEEGVQINVHTYGIWRMLEHISSLCEEKDAPEVIKETRKVIERIYDRAEYKNYIVVDKEVWKGNEHRILQHALADESYRIYEAKEEPENAVKRLVFLIQKQGMIDVNAIK